MIYSIFINKRSIFSCNIYHILFNSWEIYFFILNAICNLSFIHAWFVILIVCLCIFSNIWKSSIAKRYSQILFLIWIILSVNCKRKIFINKISCYRISILILFELQYNINSFWVFQFVFSILRSFLRLAWGKFLIRDYLIIILRLMRIWCRI